MNTNNKLTLFQRIIIIALATLFVIALVYGVKQSKGLPSGLSDKWQAVFLTDGQVYFGKLENYNGEYVLLDTVYYLKFANGLQGENAAAAATAQNLNLIKLGGEAHQPEGQMFIEKDKILFFENLKPTSPVVQAIEHNS